MHAACGHFVAGHEGHEADENGADLPCWVERFGVEVGNAKAQPGGWLKAARRRMHTDRWRGEGVVRGEYQCPPVLTIFIGGFRWAGEDVVPSSGDH